MEKEIFFIGLRSFKSKKDGQTFYIVDYVRKDKMIPKSDFISVLEFTEIQKKCKDKSLSNQIGIFSINEYDKMYLSAIK